MKTKISTRVLSFIIAILIIFSGCSAELAIEPETTTVPTTVVSEETEIVTDDDIKEISDSIKESVDDGEDLATDSLIPKSDADEESLEPDAILEHGELSYDGDITGNGRKLLGDYKGFTYMSQADPSWSNVPYTSCNNKSQTIKSSGCGPTTAAMLLSTIGSCTPVLTADLSVKHNFRSSDNGTYWSYWPFIADYFKFSFYKETSSFTTMEKYLEQDKNKDGIADYLVVVSCGPGLFTTSGHYILLISDIGNTIGFADPYLYANKFNTASRKAANVKMSGNIGYVSETNFKQYGKAKSYWIFSNESPTKVTTTTSTTTNKVVKYTRYVATQSYNLNIRAKASSSATILTTLPKGTKVKYTEVSGSWTHIVTPVNGWCSSAYLSSVKVNATSTSTATNYLTTVGKTYKFTTDQVLQSKDGKTKYYYKANTTFKVISHYNINIDYIYIPALDIYRYWSTNKNFKMK